MRVEAKIYRCLLVLCLGIALISCSEDSVPPLPTGQFKSPPAVANSIFPLHIEKNKRYLVDSNNHPFLMQGDTAWSLIAQLTNAEVIHYLDDRKEKGFNTLLVNLLEHQFSSKAPDNIYGVMPFRKKNRFDTPNEAYFSHVDWVIQQAAERGFLVLLAPAYIGYGGGNQGWYHIMDDNGTNKLRYYGRYLGLRYKDYTNIVWVHGGDYNPRDKQLVREIVLGIKEYDKRVLNTAHCKRGTAALQFWKNESWLDINSIYTKKSPYAAAKEQYNHSTMPLFLIEAYYEGESVHAHGARVEAYQALLSGAMGQVFGNNPIWHFSGPGLFKTSQTWQQALDSDGAKSMAYLRKLFDSVDWWKMVPDFANTTLTRGIHADTDRAVASLASDHTFALVYMPSHREIAVDLSTLAGPRVNASWFDPSNGNTIAVSGSPFSTGGVQSFTPASKNASGKSDWVLKLESVH